jgi:hypothetical protein|tara:strand:+ start:111 stop:368 length:258 start_codon:yes stop_codon:yes gene_type:complete
MIRKLLTTIAMSTPLYYVEWKIEIKCYKSGIKINRKLNSNNMTDRKINAALDKVWAALFNGLQLPMVEATRITNMVEEELKKLKS